MTEDAEDYAPSMLRMHTFRFIPMDYSRKERTSTLDVVKALHYKRGASIRWENALRVLARKLAVPSMEAEVLLLRALADPRNLVIGLCSRRTDSWLVQVPRSRR
jgi:hypothetical protein